MKSEKYKGRGKYQEMLDNTFDILLRGGRVFIPASKNKDIIKDIFGDLQKMGGNKFSFEDNYKERWGYDMEARKSIQLKPEFLGITIFLTK